MHPPPTMRALLCRELGEFRNLCVEQMPVPPMRPNGVRILVQFASLSYAVNLMVAGKYQHKFALPFVPGREVAGIVSEVAAGVEAIRPGDRVVAIGESGGYAEEMVASALNTYPVPDALDLRSAVTIPLSGGTAYTALLWRAKLVAGETLLVHGAAGGVGLAAVQIGRHVGARVIGCASSADKRALLRANGADLALPSNEFRDAVREFTSGRGADVVFDPVGGDVFDQSLRCMAPEGRILVIGFAGGRIPQIPANILLLKDIAVLGFNFGRYNGSLLPDEQKVFAPRVQAALRTLMDWAVSGAIAPHVSLCYPLDAFREAMDTVLTRSATGKVLLRVGGHD